jgi:hypothetical protein
MLECLATLAVLGCVRKKQVEDGKGVARIADGFPRVPPVTDSMATYVTHDYSRDRRVIAFMRTLTASSECACCRSRQLRVEMPIMDQLAALFVGPCCIFQSLIGRVTYPKCCSQWQA